MSTNHQLSEVVVSFIIVNYRVAAKVDAAVKSVEQHCELPFEVVVVDNSECGTEVALLDNLLRGRATVIDANSNRGFGAGCNLGAKVARGTFLFFLNPDALLQEPCVERWVEHFQQDSSLVALGGKLYYPNGDEGHSRGDFITARRPLQMLKGAVFGFRDKLMRRPFIRSPKHRLAQGLQRVDWCSGADLMVRRKDFETVGGFDESYFLYYEECDLQYRMQRSLGGKSAIDGDAIVFHEDGGTGLESERKRLLIEAGCMHFVRDHRSSTHYLLYRLLLIPVFATETALSAASLDLARARFHARLGWRVARAATASAV